MLLLESELKKQVRTFLATHLKTFIGATRSLMHKFLLTIAQIHTAPSAAPGNLQVTSISPYSLHLRWSPPPLEHRNGIIRRYNIVLSQLNSETRVQQSTLTNSITIRGLKAYTTYKCKVAAYTTTLGPFSSEVQNRTYEDGKYHH